MNFLIQASDPRPSKFVGPDDSSLGEAIETIFPLSTDFALMAWNNVYVPLTYKYDISIMIDDIIAMLGSVVAREDGSVTVVWPSNTFCARWIVAWSATDLTIRASWQSVIGGTESMLNKVPSVSLDKNTFLLEWKPLLYKIKESVLMASGDADIQHMFVGLDSILSKLPTEQKNRDALSHHRPPNA